MPVKHLTTAEFDGAVKAAPLSLVDFWASWCGPCKMLGPVIEAIGEQYAGKVLVAKVDVDAEPELARRFGGDEHSHGGLFENGEEFDRKIGLMSPDEFTAVLDKNLG